MHRTYLGLGAPAAAALVFERLTPYADALLALRQECAPLHPDDLALGIALDGLETAAYHFTRRRDFYHAAAEARRERIPGNGRLGDREAAVAAFKELEPHARQLRALQDRCRPFGRDYLALAIARESLDSAAFHFTREAGFYGARNDSAGPIRPDLDLQGVDLRAGRPG